MSSCQYSSDNCLFILKECQYQKKSSYPQLQLAIYSVITTNTLYPELHWCW